MIQVKNSRKKMKNQGYVPSQVGLILPSDSYCDAFLPSAIGSSR
jgi:hypothetical protein